MRRLPFLLGAVTLILMSWGCGQMMGARVLPSLPRGVRAEVWEVPYIVTGTTVPEIRLSLRTAATAALGGPSGRVGLHSSRLRYSYRYGYQGSYCQMTDVSIELESAIQVPRWTHREAADSTLVTMWDAYITALRGHEYTHREYLYRRARDIYRELYRIKRPTCDSMQSRANSTVQLINDRYRELNEQFDEESRGTLTWPPRE
jgi:predicted secreted Zn-dependent protease